MILSAHAGRGLLVTGGPSDEAEFSSGNVKDHRAYISIRWNNHQRRKGHLAQRPSSTKASQASGPKPYPDCCSLESAAQEEKDQGRS